MNESGKRSWVTIGIVVAVIAVGAVILTSREPPEEPDRADAGSAAPAEARNLDVVEISAEERAEIESWLETGLIEELLESSHEVFVDADPWDALETAEKERRVRALSLYFKSINGTQQVIVRKHGSNMIAADYFGGVLRVVE